MLLPASTGLNAALANVQIVSRWTGWFASTLGI